MSKLFMRCRVFLLPLLLLLLLGGCAGLGVYQFEPVSSHLKATDSIEATRCARLFASLDKVVDDSGVRDARATRLAGFPYLRSDRLLSALVAGADDGARFNALLHLAIEMDEESRRYEIMNLPDHSLATAESGASRETLVESLRQCRLLLTGLDLADTASRERLRAVLQVPTEYQTWKRFLGLYPLTRLAFIRGVRNWQATTETVFNTPLVELPHQGKSVIYTPPRQSNAQDNLAALFADGARNTLGLYEWNDADRELLFSIYAPRLLIDEASHDDQIGSLEYDAESRLLINTLRPVVYRRLSHTYMGGRWLPQFVYTVWFPARTSAPGIDLLAGHIDGLIWRVTVGPDGHPLVYDTIHPCGCYHLFIPTAAVRARPQPDSLDETLFSPQSLSRVSAGEFLVLHLEAGTHYLRRVTREGAAPEEHRYEFANDDELRSLRLPNPSPGDASHRSAFGPDGIIAGSERGERFLFWPMGVDNAGAMRQWGRHATAFVGERHFDDPGLHEKYFELR